ncbi:carboxypeptidase regulatory-like domain-containing protein [Patescibacteria group bacterium]|nr:carboxypeptidase regulatory-like domain-containing protein [Patescibacteria group bacterium]
MKQSFFIILINFLFFSLCVNRVEASDDTWWEFQAIDTMKYSRDVSREFLNNRALLKKVAEEQVKNIAETGATHVAIATPYDAEFLPVLQEWVSAARRHNLHVWFRGNWSGWESWFGYPRITRQEHLEKTVAFIQANPSLFQEGDYFSACPECENGGPGDPRMNGDAKGHKQFLIDEHIAAEQAFRQIGKGVSVNLNSMNGDVARLIMDKETTAALGGIVVVDHYVRTPDQLNRDVMDFAQRSGGKVILGEFGAPIPDINGRMTEEQQAAWLQESLQLLAQNPALVGLSYWTNMGGSTAIWKEDGQPTLAVAVLKGFYQPQQVSGKVTDTLGYPLNATVETPWKSVVTGTEGVYSLPYLSEDETVLISAKDFVSQEVSVTDLIEAGQIELEPVRISLWYRIQLWIKGFFSR